MGSSGEARVAGEPTRRRVRPAVRAGHTRSRQRLESRTGPLARRSTTADAVDTVSERWPDSYAWISLDIPAVLLLAHDEAVRQLARRVRTSETFFVPTKNVIQFYETETFV
ncbi:hypothetical protein AB0B74_08575 [Micromonospora parva]|uniref:hypothetical protein n=1 Tax=Micromonospora parva TaxID=1464048 RepID=UPI003402F6F1